MNKNGVAGWITLIIVGFIVIGVLTHAYGFSLAAGTLFAGLNNTGRTLEGGSIASGGTAKR